MLNQLEANDELITAIKASPAQERGRDAQKPCAHPHTYARRTVGDVAEYERANIRIRHVYDGEM